MTVSIPFPLPSTGYAYNRDMRINLQAIVDKLNDFNTGDATWDNVYIGTSNSDTGSIILYNSGTAQALTIEPGATSAAYTITLPTAKPTAYGILHSNSSGTTSWMDPTTFIVGTSNEVTVADDGDGTLTLSLPSDIQPDSIKVANSLAGPAPSIRFVGDDNAGWYYSNSGGTSTGIIHTIIDSANIAQFKKASIEFNQELTINEGSNPGLTIFASGSDATDSKAYIKLWTYDGVGGGPGDCWVWATDGSSKDISYGLDNDENKFAVCSGSTLANDATLHFQSSGGGIQLPGGNTLTIDGATSGTVTLDVPATITSYSFTFPDDSGSSGEVLQTDGSGNTSWVSVGGAGGATTALDNLASVAINTSLISDTDATDDLGSSGIGWKDIYLTGALFNGATELATVTELGYLDGVTSNLQTQLDAKAASADVATKELDNLGTVAINTSLISDTDNTDNLGSAAIGWATGYINQLIMDGATSGTHTIAPAATAGTRTYTIPDAGGNTDFVMGAGAQTIAGVKTFSSFPVTPSAAPTTDYQVANKKYVDDNAGATTALDNLASVAINTSLISDTDNTDDLGSSTVSWKDLYLDGSIKHGTTACLTMDSIGAVTKPNQPSFLVYNSATDSSVTGNGTEATVEFDTEVYDLNSDFNTTTDTFTAPVTGKYQLNATIRAVDMSTSASAILLRIVTSNRTYEMISRAPRIDDPNTTYNWGHIGDAVLADMDANDTATVTITVFSMAADDAGIYGNATNSRTRFSGSLIN